MWDKLPVKKEYLLIAASMLLLFLSYELALKKTIEAWQINKQLKDQLTRGADVSYQPAYLDRKNKNLTNILNKYKTDTVAFRSNTISSIALIAEKEHVKLSEVPLQDPLFHTDQYIVEKLNFEGSFFALTKVLNNLLATNGIGLIRSAAYKVTGINTNSNQQKRLILEVYLETIK